MPIYVVDAFSWIEYFRGSKPAEQFRKLLADQSNEFITMECTVAEIRLWALRVGQDFDKLFRIIQANSSLSAVTLHDWIDAAAVRQEMRKTREQFGLIDAILLTKQRELHCRLISGDEHFKGLPLAVFLPGN